MTNRGLTKTEARRTIAAVEKALKAGHPRVGHARRRSAAQIAAEALGLPARTVADRVRGDGALARMGLGVDWRLHRPAPKGAPAAPDVEREREGVAAADRIADLERRLKASHRESLSEETLRARVFELAREPLRPQAWKLTRDAHGKAREAVILCVSDVHFGEVISLEQMGGRNSYNRAIAARRLQRLFARAVELMTEHWTGPPPAVVYVALLGDLVSGGGPEGPGRGRRIKGQVGLPPPRS